jgi:pyruvate dehydrogenase E1 component alpha subunit
MTSLSLELYRKMYLIRRTEEAICRHYNEDEMKTPVHLSIGEEAIAVGVIHALAAHDQFFGTYRSHGIYLARTGETDKFFAELYGKETGLLRGRAGSMHLSAPESGFMGTSAVVAGIIPVAMGAAYANKVTGNGSVVVVFFGDGATEEGVFWESINAACLMELPILFICEDNELAVFTDKAHRRGFDSLPAILEKFRCTVVADSTTDVERIHLHAQEAIASIREQNRPCFLDLAYYRYREHVGVCEDFHCGYRTREEFEEWFKVDPIKIQRDRLLNFGYPESELQEFETAIEAQIEGSMQLASEAPFPREEELFRAVTA